MNNIDLKLNDNDQTKAILNSVSPFLLSKIDIKQHQFSVPSFK